MGGCGMAPTGWLMGMVYYSRYYNYHYFYLFLILIYIYIYIYIKKNNLVIFSTVTNNQLGVTLLTISQEQK